MICVSLGNISPDNALKLCQQVQMVEIRTDLLRWSSNDYLKVIESGVKTVFTCRPGYYNEAERLNLFEFAIKSGAGYIDIEFESDSDFLEKIREIKKLHSAELIISYHNFECTPTREDLENILQKCYIMGAEVAKIACRVFSYTDVAILLSLYEKSGRKVIIGMGNPGKISRIAALYLGAEFTFASTGRGDETAEGQIDYKTLNEITKLIN